MSFETDSSPGPKLRRNKHTHDKKKKKKTKEGGFYIIRTVRTLPSSFFLCEISPSSHRSGRQNSASSPNVFQRCSQSWLAHTKSSCGLPWCFQSCHESICRLESFASLVFSLQGGGGSYPVEDANDVRMAIHCADNMVVFGIIVNSLESQLFPEALHMSISTTWR